MKKYFNVVIDRIDNGVAVLIDDTRTGEIFIPAPLLPGEVTEGDSMSISIEKNDKKKLNRIKKIRNLRKNILNTDETDIEKGC